jgi:tungstate transport system ATP-binding protein
MIEARRRGGEVVVRALQRAPGGSRILDVDELAFPPGSVQVIVGSNGAGKTTLLRVLGCLDRPDAGSISIFGVDPWRAPNDLAESIRQRIAFCAQRPCLFSTTVSRNVEYPLNLRGVEPGEAHRRAADALVRMGVAHLSARPVDGLSTGEAQRVAIARAVAYEPELVLLDEPLANMDPEGVDAIERVVNGLTRVGATVVIATHLAELAYRFSGAVVRLEAGRIAPSVVENVLSGSLSADECGAAITLGGGLKIAVAASPAVGARPVRAVIGPADILVSARALESSARNSLPARVTGLRQRGPEVLVSADAGVQLVASVTNESCRALGLTIGTEVVLTFKATAVRIL